ncbi:MAG TPA: chorismate synthase, partial [Methanomassiliicoccales archaeon]|nr:chorismate synthase [Methanomassiliicoccales archaeon]
MNTYGMAFRVTVFGSSHGPGIGCVVDGCPSGIEVTSEKVQRELDRRRPSPAIGTPRTEEDLVLIQSGVHEGRTTGSPLQMFIENRDRDSSKYAAFKRTPRPGHADYPAMVKYGPGHDIRGGGQFSGRMTAPLVAAGSVAKSLLEREGIRFAAYTLAIGKVRDEMERSLEEVADKVYERPARAATDRLDEDMRSEILAAKEDGDSVGGIVRCLVEGLPVGLGEPFFDTLDGELAKLLFAVPAVKGVEFGSGFQASRMRGSENNDVYRFEGDEVRTATNHAGGVLGGMSNGMPLDLKVAFKPTASIPKAQRTVDLGTG